MYEPGCFILQAEVIDIVAVNSYGLRQWDQEQCPYSSVAEAFVYSHRSYYQLNQC